MPATSNAISYTLMIGGAPAPPALMAAVQMLQVEDHAEMADLLRLKVNVGVRPDGAGWTVLDERIFTRLAAIEVKARVGNVAETLIKAYVVETSVNFSVQPGQTVLTVVAMDPTVLMNLEEKIRPWPDMSDSDIAGTIFGEYGFSTKVSDTQPARSESELQVTQRGTDISFLEKLASRNGCEVYVETSPSGELIGHFHPPDLDERPQGVLTVNMAQETNVSAFSVRNDMLKPVTAKVTGLEADSLEGQPAESLSQSGKQLGSGTAVAADRPRVVLMSANGLSRSGELQTAAQSLVDRSGWAISADGELNTSTYGAILRAKRPVMVRGAGRELSGTYYVERVLHTFTSAGHVQRFTIKRNALGLTGQESFMEDNAL